MIIGLTGLNCSGKDTIAEYLRKKGFYYVSLSDVIRDELADEGIPITRENLIKKGNELRAKFGSHILAQRTVEKMQKGRHYCVVSIRNPGEVEELRKLEGFTLVHVNASPRTRFARMRKRARNGDAQTFEAFMHIEKAEAKNLDKTRQQLSEVINMAEKRIDNETNFRNLYMQIDSLLAELSSEFKPKRPSWDNYFMSIAQVVSKRSNCMKRQVAAIIVKDKRIISTGYNGTPRGTKNCDEGGCKRCNSFADSGTKLDECVCSHGEENAIVQSAYHGISIKGSTIYTTYSPCLNCTKMIINSGIKEVVYNEAYPMPEQSIALLKEAGIIIRQVKI